MMMAGGRSDIIEMTIMGADTSLLAPAVYLLTRRWLPWDKVTLPAVPAVSVFLLAHTGITIWMALHMPTWSVDWLYQLGLLIASLIFWLPVLGPRRLGPGGRMIYLFAAMPAMDMSGVFVVLHGDAAGGLAMIVAMLPVGVAAVASTWYWVATEEAAVSGDGFYEMVRTASGDLPVIRAAGYVETPTTRTG